MSRVIVPPGEPDLVCLGETLIDMLSLELAGSLAEAEAFGRHLGGSPANIALYLAKLGGRAAVVSRVGAGAFGSYAADQLAVAGVDTSTLVRDPARHTTVVFVSRTTGSPDFEAFRAADAALTVDDLPIPVLQRARIVHGSTFALTATPSRDAVLHGLEVAASAGRLVSFDPNYAPELWPDRAAALATVERAMAHADITKPSLDDGRRLFGDDAPPEVYVERFHAMGPRLVVLTMGAAGTLVSHEGRIEHVPARPVTVADATAAGDSYWAGFLYGLLRGDDVVTCAKWGRAVAEVKLRHVGHVPGAIDADEVGERLDP